MRLDSHVTLKNDLKNSFELQYVEIKQGAEKDTMMKIINRWVKKRKKEKRKNVKVQFRLFAYYHCQY